MYKLLISFIFVGFLSIAIAANAASPISSQVSKEINMFDCDTFKWFQNCSQVNKTIRDFPNAPIRVITKDKHEYNFPPGTPTLVIRHMSELSPASAKALADYYDRDSVRRNLAAKLWKKEIIRRGNLDGSPKLQELYAIPEGKIDYKNVILYVFYDSKCNVCKILLPGLRNIKNRHKKLNITLIQMDNDINALDKINKEYSLNAKKAKAGVKKKYGKIIKVYPTLWYENRATNKQSIVAGYAPEKDIENNLRAMSK